MYLPLPQLKTASHKADSIQIGANTGNLFGGDTETDEIPRGGKWEDEEERRFFEDIPDLKDYVPRGILGIDEDDTTTAGGSKEERELKEKEKAEEDMRKLEEELAGLEVNEDGRVESKINGHAGAVGPDDVEEEEEDG